LFLKVCFMEILIKRKEKALQMQLKNKKGVFKS
jgi:hypothetical protein